MGSMFSFLRQCPVPYPIAKLNANVGPIFSSAVLRRWGRPIGLFIISFCLVWCVAGSTLAQTRLTWENLQPAVTTLQNPYAHLPIEQTRDLATLAGLKAWIKGESV